MSEPTKEELLARIAELEKQSGGRKKGALEFRVGEIAGQSIKGTVDLAVSLHACDTATDDALARAVAWKAAAPFSKNSFCQR